jgi:hypothetical protein
MHAGQEGLFVDDLIPARKPIVGKHAITTPFARPAYVKDSVVPRPREGHAAPLHRASGSIRLHIYDRRGCDWCRFTPATTGGWS